MMASPNDGGGGLPPLPSIHLPSITSTYTAASAFPVRNLPSLPPLEQHLRQTTNLNNPALPPLHRLLPAPNPYGYRGVPPSQIGPRYYLPPVANQAGAQQPTGQSSYWLGHNHTSLPPRHYPSNQPTNYPNYLDAAVRQAAVPPHHRRPSYQREARRPSPSPLYSIQQASRYLNSVIESDGYSTAASTPHSRTPEYVPSSSVVRRWQRYTSTPVMQASDYDKSRPVSRGSELLGPPCRGSEPPAPQRGVESSAPQRSIAPLASQRPTSPAGNQLLMRVQPQALVTTRQTGSIMDSRIPLNLGSRVFMNSSQAAKKRKTISNGVSSSSNQTKLSTKNPVSAFVPIDIWLQIFRFLEPRQLFEMKTVCKGFYECLKDKSMPWRQCRLAYFYDEIPPPPKCLRLKKGSEERQYLDLLAGHVQFCMSCGSNDKNASGNSSHVRKVYWVFGRRWCKDCFEKKTVNFSLMDRTPLVNEISPILREYPALAKCVMWGTVDSWGSYIFAGNGTPLLQREGARGPQGVVLKEDIKEAYDELRQYMDQNFTNKTEDERAQLLDEYFVEKQKAIEEFLKPISKIEEWFRIDAIRKVRANDRLKKDREEYYLEQASMMDDPMTREELELIPAYIRAIKLPKAPCPRSWSMLQEKVVLVRDEVRELIRQERRASAEDMVKSYNQIPLQRLDEVRECVENLAQRAYDELYPVSTGTPLDETQMTVNILSRVYDFYYDIPDTGRPRSLLSNGTSHVLSIEDVCTVYDWLETSFFRNGWEGGNRRPGLFNCPGCCRADVKKQYLPRDLFLHIRSAHARGVGDFVSFRRMGPFDDDRKQYLFLVPWPKNLPMLPSSKRSTNGRWCAEGTVAEMLERELQGSKKVGRKRKAQGGDGSSGKKARA